MSYIDPISGERVTAAPVPEADRTCAVCAVALDHDRDDLAFTFDGRLVHAEPCAEEAAAAS